MIWTLTDKKDRNSLELQFEWLRDMNGIPQDQFHHAEGDVATHTWRVIEELQKLPGYFALTEQDKEKQFSLL